MAAIPDGKRKEKHFCRVTRDLTLLARLLHSPNTISWKQRTID